MKYPVVFCRALLLLLSLLGPAVPGRAEAIGIGNRKQLFLDDKFLGDAQGVELRMNSPMKQGLVLAGSGGWDNGVISSYGTVLEDYGKCRLWYTAVAATSKSTEDSTYRLCYAESVDGVHWTKPELGLYEWQGSKANNILMEAANESVGVFIDPTASADARYKLLASMRRGRGARGATAGDGMYMYTSPDGLRWTLHPINVFPFTPDTLNVPIYDDRTGKYLIYVRTWNPQRRVGVVETSDIMRPWPYDKTVPPRPWPGHPHDTPAPSREVPDAFGTDAGDPPNIDHYTSAAVKYPWAEDAYLLFPSAYRHFPEPPKGKLRNDGTLDIQMAVSRDGRKFHRISRGPYIGLGPTGSRDSCRAYMTVGMIRRGGMIYQYYAGHDRTHAAYEQAEEKKHRGGILLAYQRLDGFVSADAGSAGGHFTTPTLVFQGRRLALNLDASGTGEVRVELQGADGTAIAGHAFADSDALYLNDVAKEVTWRGGDSDVSRFAGLPVRLAFRLRSAKLFAFQFVD